MKLFHSYETNRRIADEVKDNRRKRMYMLMRIHLASQKCLACADFKF